LLRLPLIECSHNMIPTGVTIPHAAKRFLLLALDPRGWGEATFAVYLGRTLRDDGHHVNLLHSAKTLPLLAGTDLPHQVLPDDRPAATTHAVDQSIDAFRPDALVLCDIVTTERALSVPGSDPKRVLARGLPVVGVDSWDGELTGPSVDLFRDQALEVATWLGEVPLRIRPVPFLDPVRPGACRFLPDCTPVPAGVRNDVRRELGIGDTQRAVLFCTADWQHTSYTGDGGRLGRQLPLLLGRYLARLGSDVHLLHLGPRGYPLDPILGPRYHWLPPRTPVAFDAVLAASDLLLSANITAATVVRAVVAQTPVVVVQNSVAANSAEEVAARLGTSLLPEVEQWLDAALPIYRFPRTIARRRR
jgi:hypothetical protein